MAIHIVRTLCVESLAIAAERHPSVIRRGASEQGDAVHFGARSRRIYYSVGSGAKRTRSTSLCCSPVSGSIEPVMAVIAFIAYRYLRS